MENKKLNIMTKELIYLASQPDNDFEKRCSQKNLIENSLYEMMVAVREVCEIHRIDFHTIVDHSYDLYYK